ncbi:hypothetical protein C8R44DRAFT_101992 [Mycena epipterygia]|nr:hypothetical protein C8R44DRAFT_101992 [Mycena epipterygia]
MITLYLYSLTRPARKGAPGTSPPTACPTSTSPCGSQSDPKSREGTTPFFLAAAADYVIACSGRYLLVLPYLVQRTYYQRPYPERLDLRRSPRTGLRRSQGSSSSSAVLSGQQAPTFDACDFVHRVLPSLRPYRPFLPAPYAPQRRLCTSSGPTRAGPQNAVCRCYICDRAARGLNCRCRVRFRAPVLLRPASSALFRPRVIVQLGVRQVS